MTKVCSALVLAALFLLPSTGYSEYGDVVMDTHKEVMAKVGLDPVVFPHWIHRMKYKCKACHEQVFAMEKGASRITMAEIINGGYCGECHNGRISWDPLYCDRCHTHKAEPDLAVPAPAAQ